MKMKYLKKLNENTNFDNENGLFEKTLINVQLADDWEGIYHNGKLLNEGHSVRWDMVIDTLIKEGVDLSGYKYSRLNHYKDGQYEDWTSIGKWGEPVMHNLPGNITEYISEIKKHGYDYKLS